MEKVIHCPICNSTEKNILYQLPDYENSADKNIYHVVQCVFCDSCYLSNRPTVDEMGQHYYHEYLPYTGNYGSLSRFFITLRSKKEIKKLRKFFPDAKKILEVGCSYGQYLNDLRRFGGFSVTGIETDTVSCERGRQLFNIDIYNDRLENIHFDDDSFDVVVMNFVIEHLHDPSQVIERLQRIVRTGGLLLIKTHDIDTVERKFFGRYWPFEAPRHVVLFSRKSLEIFLQKRGFSTLKVSYHITPNDIILSMRNFMLKHFGVNRGVWVRVNHIFLILLFLPISFILALFKQSGRITLIARKI